MNFDVYFTIDMVVLLRSKTLKVMFVGYVENELLKGPCMAPREEGGGNRCYPIFILFQILG